MEQTYFDPSYLRTSVFPITDNTYDLGAGALAFRSAYLTTSLIFTSTFSILANTSDGSDSRDLFLAGGGSTATDGSRGAWVRVSGNESASVGGITMRSGTATGSYITLDVSSSDGAIALKNQNTQVVWITNLGMQLKLTTNLIYTGTSDGSDNAAIQIAGGGAAGSSRGATMYLLGNEAQGYVLVSAGAVSTGSIYFDLNHASASIFFRNTAGNAMWQITAGGALTQAATNGTDIVFNTTGTAIRFGTSDGSDNKYLTVCGGGAYGNTRGSSILLTGNEEAGHGSAEIMLGNLTDSHLSVRLFNSSAAFRVQNNGSTLWSVDGAGTLLSDATNGGGLILARSGANVTPIISGASSLDADLTFRIGTHASLVTVQSSAVGTVMAHCSYAADASGNIIDYLKSREASGSAANTIVSSGDVIAQFRFWGADGATFQSAARIQVVVDGTPGVSDMPGRIELWTTADGAASSLRRWFVDNAGHFTSDSTNGGDIVVSTTTGLIRQATADGSDNGILTITTGSAYNSGGSRGGLIRLYGNENGTAGPAVIQAGSASAAYVGLVAPASNGYIRILINGADEWSFAVNRVLKFASTDGTISASTNDGSDNAILYLTGGGAFNGSGTRGAYIQLTGNETAQVGTCQISAGNTTSASINLIAPGSSGSIRHICNGSDWMTINAGGYITIFNTTAPGGTPSGSGYLYAESGALKWKGSGGTVTTVAPA